MTDENERVVRLVLTCGACPEQYDAFLGERKVGYLRLRHGAFRVDFPECGGETIYEANPNGDGIFDKDERDYYLRFAVAAILRRLDTGRPPERPPAPDVKYEIIGELDWN
jgi:hypothetical protein